jgi:hypothetical protein
MAKLRMFPASEQLGRARSLRHILRQTAGSPDPRSAILFTSISWIGEVFWRRRHARWSLSATNIQWRRRDCARASVSASAR